MAMVTGVLVRGYVDMVGNSVKASYWFTIYTLHSRLNIFFKLLNDYTFANRLSRRQEIVSALNFKPKILQRKSIIERVADKIQAFINTFIEGMSGSVGWSILLLRLCLVIIKQNKVALDIFCRTWL